MDRDRDFHFYKGEKWCQKGQEPVTPADFFGDHFPFWCRDRQEERQQPQRAVLFRSEVAEVTTGSLISV